MPMVRRKRARQAIAVHAAQDDAAAVRNASAFARIVPQRCGKCTSRKLPTLGVTSRPRRELLRQPGKPLVIMGDGALDMRLVGDRRSAGSKCRGADIEGPPNAVQHVGDMGRAIGPAEAQRSQAIDLRESARHHDIVEWSRRARCPIHSRCAAHIRRKPRRAPAGSPAAGRHGGVSLHDRNIGAGRVVGIGEEDDARLRA